LNCTLVCDEEALHIFQCENHILLKTWSQAYIYGSLIGFVSVLYNIFLHCILNLSSKPFIEMFLYYHLSFVNMALYIYVSNFIIFIDLLPFASLYPTVDVISLFVWIRVTRTNCYK
jgi:hypothetical protein